MLHLSVEGHDIKFSFSHLRHLGQEAGVTDATVCTFELDGKTYTGLAACSAHDTFNKETGRKLALARALKQLTLSKKVREAIWQRYFNRGVPNGQYFFNEALVGVPVARY